MLQFDHSWFATRFSPVNSSSQYSKCYNVITAGLPQDLVLFILYHSIHRCYNLITAGLPQYLVLLTLYHSTHRCYNLITAGLP